VVVQNALFWGSKKYSSLTIPWCTYTDPEIAHVGMYEKDAAEKGVAVDTFTVDMSDVDRAVLEGEEEGMVRVHVKKGSDTILGATIVARHAGEMISEVSVAMEGRVGLNALSGVIHPYPTQAEAIRKAADAYRRTRLTPGVKRLFQFLLKLQRGG
jgi:pyruvate/2-oxoglutarate dehydrogenase complex dihydrolipoamide dehydrogenase (E3) component